MSPAQPKVNDQETLKLLMDNIHNLEYPLLGRTQWIKLPYFQDQFAPNRPGVLEVKKRFCEAIVLLLESNDRLKKRRKTR